MSGLSLSLNLSDLVHTVQGVIRRGLRQGLSALSADQIRKIAVTLPRLVLKPEIGGLVLLLFILIFPVGLDNVVKPLWEKQKVLDIQLNDQRNRIAQKQAEVKQFKEWQQQLKGLDIDLQSVNEGQSAKVLAVSQSSQLIALAKGETRDSDLGPPLPAPYNTRTFVSLTPGEVSIVNIIKQGTAASASSAPVGPHEGQPGDKPSPEKIAADKAIADKLAADKAEADKKAAENNTLNIWRFDYELKVQGTYPALADMLNQWVNSKQLVILRAITLVPVAGANLYTDNPFNTPASIPAALVTPMDVASLNAQEKTAEQKTPETTTGKPDAKNNGKDDNSFRN